MSVNVGRKHRPIRNTAILTELMDVVATRDDGMQGIGVFYGWSGLGKTWAGTHVAVQYQAICVQCVELWSKKDFLNAILNEMAIPPRGTSTDRFNQAAQFLAASGRPLIIDEVDYMVDKKYINLIRDLHDQSEAAIILIGEEELPQKLTKWERVDGRVLKYSGAEPADLRDAKLLASAYAEGLAVSDEVLGHLVDRSNGSTRRIVGDLVDLKEKALRDGVRELRLGDFDGEVVGRGPAPMPRRYVA
ncbi:MAG: AAA family ATPase [Shimia sp.]